MPLITTRVTSAVDATTKNAPLTNAEIDTNFINLNNAIIQSGDVTGFSSRTNNTIAFTDATRTFTLAPTGANFVIYHKGRAVTISSAQTLVIANSSGSHWIHWDYAQNRLVDVGANPNIRENLLVAYIYWDSTSSSAVFFSDERHSASVDKNWHYSKHLENGAVWRSGGDLTCTLNNSNTVSLALSNPIVLADEDLEHTITHSDNPAVAYEQQLLSFQTGLGAFPVLYLNGTTYSSTASTTLPWYPSTTRAFYNQVTNGVGSLVTASSDDLFIVYWLVATNDTRAPIKLVMGRNTWSTYGEAETENFVDYGLPMPEIAPMYKIILKTRTSYTQNLARVTIVAARELMGKQNSRSNGFDSLSHEALSDRFADNQHSISSITDLQTTLDSVAGASVAMAIALG